jgi:hypothetical protein
MNALSATLVCFALFVQATSAADKPEVELTLPHPLHAGDVPFVEVQLGAMRRGEEIQLTTALGRELGVISPFAVRVGQEAGTYTLPLPPNIFVNGRIKVRLTVKQNDHTQRLPTAEEVKAVRVKIAPIAH